MLQQSTIYHNIMYLIAVTRLTFGRGEMKMAAIFHIRGTSSRRPNYFGRRCRQIHFLSPCPRVSAPSRHCNPWVRSLAGHLWRLLWWIHQIYGEIITFISDPVTALLITVATVAVWRPSSGVYGPECDRVRPQEWVV